MYKRDFSKDSSFNKSSSNKKKNKMASDKRNKGKQEEKGKYKPGLSVFHLRLGDYLCAMRGTGFFLTKTYKQRQIQELEKLASKNQSIKPIFAASQIYISQKTSSVSENSIS